MPMDIIKKGVFWYSQFNFLSKSEKLTTIKGLLL